MFEKSIILSLIDISIFILTLFFINKLLNKTNVIGFTIRKSALILGFSIAISSSFLSNGIEKDYFIYPLFTILDTFIIISLLLLSLKINNKLILNSLDNDKLIEKGNISIPIIEAGTTIATSIILFSSMYGDGKYIDSFIFFILGQISLLLMVRIYEKVTKFDDFALIKNNNISISIVLFTVIVGFSIIVGSSIFGDSSGLGIKADIISFLYVFVLSIILLALLLNQFLDKIFFLQPNINEEIENDNIKTILPYCMMKLSIMIIIAVIL